MASDGQLVFVATTSDVETVVWRFTDAGDLWARWFELGGAVTAIVVAPGGAIFAGTSTGVYVSRDQGHTFELWKTSVGPRRVIGLALAPDSLVYALELGGRLWRGRDERGC